MSAKVIEHKGRLAIQVAGWMADQDEPIKTLLLAVSNIPFSQYSRLEGVSIEFRGNVGTAYHEGRYYTFDTTDKRTWTRTMLERPVKRPRRGKRDGVPYTWRWERGKWERVWLWEKLPQ